MFPRETVSIIEYRNNINKIQFLQLKCVAVEHNSQLPDQYCDQVGVLESWPKADLLFYARNLW